LAKIAIFSGCAHEFMYPEQLAKGIELMERRGFSVSFPLEQGCCGLPAITMGQKKAAIKCAAHNVEAFHDAKADYIVTLCASCASHLKHGYPELLADKPEYLEEVGRFTGKIIDFSSFVNNVLKLQKGDFIRNGEKVGYHCPCHLRHGLGVTTAPRELIAMASQYVPSPDEENCCGFGGHYSVKFPEISAALAQRKLKRLEGLGVNTVVTDCPGCVMQLRGTEEKRGRILPVEHISEFLSRLLKPVEQDEKTVVD
jgi:Fe-S oxidoreductase